MDESLWDLLISHAVFALLMCMHVILQLSVYISIPSISISISMLLIHSIWRNMYTILQMSGESLQHKAYCEPYEEQVLRYHMYFTYLFGGIWWTWPVLLLHSVKGCNMRFGSCCKDSSISCIRCVNAPLYEEASQYIISMCVVLTYHFQCKWDPNIHRNLLVGR